LKNSKTLIFLDEVSNKRQLFIDNLQHPKIKNIYGHGLMIALEFESDHACQSIIEETLKGGVITFYFLFNRNNMRISPPLNIQNKDIRKACSIIKESIDKYYKE